MSARATNPETVFVDHAVTLLRDWLPRASANFRIAREVGAGRQIADVVILSVPTTAGHNPDHPLTIAESVILSSLRRHGATRIDLLEKRCGIEHFGLRQGALDRLLQWGLVSRQRGGRVSMAGQWQTSSEIYAIEAKLCRWRQALDQAVKYRQYADYSYVLLPELAAGPATKAINEFRMAGVGLIVGGETGVTTVFDAPKCHDHDWRREFVYSRLLQAEAVLGAQY